MSFLKTTVIALAAFLLAACETTPSTTRPGSRTIVLGGETYSEALLGKFASWRCKDFVYGGSTLVEVGMFTGSLPLLSESGFVLYDGGNSGERTQYRRQGLNQRWDWGPRGTNFAFIVEPDGTGLYYDFSSVPAGEQSKAKSVYKCAPKKG